MKVRSKFKLLKFCIVVLLEVIAIVLALLIAKYGRQGQELYEALSKEPIFWPIVVIAALIVTLGSQFTEDFFYDNWARLWLVKRINKGLKELKKQIGYSLRKLEVELEKPGINVEDRLTGFDTSRSGILTRCAFEIERGDVDDLSLLGVIQALEDSDIEEVIATSNSPLNIWFITEMVCYITVQLKVKLMKSIRIRRFILEDSEKGLTELEKKFNPPGIRFDEYGVVKQIHRDAIELYIVPETDIPVSIASLPENERSILWIRFKTDPKERVWTFSFREDRFTYAFTEILNLAQKGSFVAFLNDLNAGHSIRIV